MSVDCNEVFVNACNDDGPAPNTTPTAEVMLTLYPLFASKTLSTALMMNVFEGAHPAVLTAALTKPHSDVRRELKYGSF